MCTLGFFQHRSLEDFRRFKCDDACESSSYLAGTGHSSNMFPSVHTRHNGRPKLASHLESADWLIVDAQWHAQSVDRIRGPSSLFLSPH